MQKCFLSTQIPDTQNHLHRYISCREREYAFIQYRRLFTESTYTIMKKLLILSMMLGLCIATISAQTRKEIKAAEKALQQEVNALIADGWRVSPGQLSLIDQQRRAKKFQNELDAEGYPKYVTGNAQSVGRNYDAAKMQALEFAKQDAARKVQSDVAGIVENDLSNEQLAPGEAESTVETVLASKSFFKQKMGRSITLMECYRVLPNRNTEVMTVVAFDARKVLEAATSEIKKELKARGKELHKELDEMMSNEK